MTKSSSSARVRIPTCLSNSRSVLVGVVIREAAADDYEVLCELFDEVDALHRDNLPQIFQKPTGPVWEQETYRD